MKLIVHVGLHKTGTTSFQAFMASQRELLLKQACLYPNTARFGPQHALLPGAFIRPHAALDQIRDRLLSPKGYLYALRDEIQNASPRLCVLSSEVFTELIQKDRSSCVELLQDLSGLCSEILLLVTVREPRKSALSSLKGMQRLSYGPAISSPLHVYLQARENHVRSRQLWRDSGFPCVEKSYDDANGNVVPYYFAEILSQLGVANDSQVDPAWRAASLNVHANTDQVEPYAYLVSVVMAQGLPERQASRHLRLSDVKAHPSVAARSVDLRGMVSSANLSRFIELAAAQIGTSTSADRLSHGMALDLVGQSGVTPEGVMLLDEICREIRASVEAAG